MKTLSTYLLTIGMICSAFGVSYGLYNENSRPFVILFVLVSWAFMLWEMKKAPLEKINE